jgi:hypothetical protein
MWKRDSITWSTVSWSTALKTITDQPGERIIRLPLIYKQRSVILWVSGVPNEASAVFFCGINANYWYTAQLYFVRWKVVSRHQYLACFFSTDLCFGIGSWRGHIYIGNYIKHRLQGLKQTKKRILLAGFLSYSFYVVLLRWSSVLWCTSCSWL